MQFQNLTKCLKITKHYFITHNYKHSVFEYSTFLVVQDIKIITRSPKEYPLNFIHNNFILLFPYYSCSAIYFRMTFSIGSVLTLHSIPPSIDKYRFLFISIILTTKIYAHCNRNYINFGFICIAPNVSEKELLSAVHMYVRT